MPINEANPGVKRGRPAYKPSVEDSEKVAKMYCVGLRETDIATILSISPKTLRKHFRRELATAHLFANNEVLTRLYKEAVAGRHIAATIFWAKTRCGFRQSGPVHFPDSARSSNPPSTPSPDPPPAPSVAEDIAFICDPFVNEGAPNAD